MIERSVKSMNVEEEYVLPSFPIVKCSTGNHSERYYELLDEEDCM